MDFINNIRILVTHIGMKSCVLFTFVFHFLLIITTQSIQAYNVWLDCDPGLDDVMAILLAAKSERINLIGVSTSAGNTNLDSSTKNALDILHNIGRSDVVVVRGSENTTHGQMHLAEYIHGQGGLGGVIIEPSPKPAITQNKFKYIRDKIMKTQGKVIWANTGALTNLCLMLRYHPQIKQKLQKIVIMGGAIGKGNISPAAEFNVYFDPQAFKEVLSNKGSVPLVMIPLQVTHQVQARESIFNFLQKRNKTPFANAILKMLTKFKVLYKQSQNFDYPPIHDPTVINYILFPQNFQLQKVLIDVDVGKSSYGRTNCYFHDPTDPRKPFNSIDKVATRMRKRKQFWGRFQQIFSQIFKVNSEEL